MGRRLVLAMVFMAALLPLAATIPAHPQPSFSTHSHVSDSDGWQEACTPVDSIHSLQGCAGALIEQFNPADPRNAVALLGAFQSFLDGISGWLQGVGRCGQNFGQIREVCAVSDVVGQIGTQIGEVEQTFRDILNLPNRLLEAFVERLNEFHEQMFDAAQDINDAVGSFLDTVLVDPARGVVETIESFFDGLLDFIDRSFGAAT